MGSCASKSKPNPLAIVDSPRRLAKSCSRLRFDASGDTFSFRTDAPVLGMGEGAQQFDRRGARYNMRDGWGAWERPTHGSWVAVPFLIGTDGWALFVHHPLGEFDLREPEAKFTPWLGQTDTPLVAYVMAWDKPADVLQEYVRLAGPAPHAAQMGAGLHAIAPHAGRAGGSARKSPARFAKRNCRATR